MYVNFPILLLPRGLPSPGGVAEWLSRIIGQWGCACRRVISLPKQRAWFTPDWIASAYAVTDELVSASPDARVACYGGCGVSQVALCNPVDCCERRASASHRPFRDRPQTIASLQVLRPGWAREMRENLTLDEISGAFGDLGTWIPLSVALAQQGSVDFAAVLFWCGFQLPPPPPLPPFFPPPTESLFPFTSRCEKPGSRSYAATWLIRVWGFTDLCIAPACHPLHPSRVSILRAQACCVP